MIGKVIGHIEQKNGSKYLVFVLQMKTKKYEKNTKNFGMGIKMKLRP